MNLVKVSFEPQSYSVLVACLLRAASPEAAAPPSMDFCDE